MNNLKVFEQREVLGRDFKIYGTKENPLFLAKDVAEWIEHANVTLMINKVDEEERELDYIIDSSGQRRKATFLTEDGLYEVLMQSRKPIAKAFKKEVKAILKQIRQTGGYIPVKEEDSEMDILAKAVLISQRTIEKKDAIIAQQRSELASQTKQLEEQQPKVEYYETVLNSSNLVTITKIANDLGFTAMELNNILKELGVQNKQYGYWKISKDYLFLIEIGYADYQIINRAGRSIQHLKWTEMGRKWIIDLLEKKNLL